VDTWCNRNPDGRGGQGRIRVYFTATACGQRLPAGVTLPAVITDGEQTSVPFVVYATAQAASSKSVSIRTGRLNYVTSTVPLSAYALNTPGDATLKNLSVQGPVHVAGHLTLSGTVTLQGPVSVADCAFVTAGCQGEGGVTLGVGAAKFTPGAMVPSPTALCTDAACLIGGPLNSRASGDVPVAALVVSHGKGPKVCNGAAPQCVGDTVTFAPFSAVKLGVEGGGSEQIQLCNASTCQTYLASVVDGNTTLNQLNADGSGVPLSSNWDGIMRTTGDVTLSPLKVNQPSVAVNLSVATTGVLTVNGEITDAASNCAEVACVDGNTPGILGLISDARVTVLNAARLHASVVAPILSYSSDLTLLGSVSAQLSGTGNVRIQHDPRLAVPHEYQATAVPLLPPAVRMVNVALD